MKNIYFLFLSFVIYSVIGWILEVIYCKILDGKFYNRGFLHGPYCPIYGFGAISIVILLVNFYNNPPLVFILGLILTSILEYITSFIMEKIFKAKWWDYSNYKFNIHGRVCLKHSIIFGFLSLLLIYILNPLISKFINIIDISYISIIFYLIFTLMAVDLSLTIAEVMDIKKKLSDLKDLTQTFIKEKNIFSENVELSLKLDEFKNKILSRKNIINNRLIKVFPNLTFKENAIEFLKLKEFINKNKQNNYNKKNK